ncbi:pyrimidine/purine nucleoside phosphorylase, partial [Psychromonas arctica]
MSIQANEYFDCNVKSIAFQTARLAATVGVMEVGEYTLGTEAYEYLTVV